MAYDQIASRHRILLIITLLYLDIFKAFVILRVCTEPARASSLEPVLGGFGISCIDGVPFEVTLLLGRRTVLGLSIEVAFADINVVRGTAGSSLVRVTVPLVSPFLPARERSAKVCRLHRSDGHYAFGDDSRALIQAHNTANQHSKEGFHFASGDEQSTP